LTSVNIPEVLVYIIQNAHLQNCLLAWIPFLPVISIVRTPQRHFLLWRPDDHMTVQSLKIESETDIMLPPYLRLLIRLPYITHKQFQMRLAAATSHPCCSPQHLNSHCPPHFPPLTTATSSKTLTTFHQQSLFFFIEPFTERKISTNSIMKLPQKSKAT
jgi:hypothetical protein